MTPTLPGHFDREVGIAPERRYASKGFDDSFQASSCLGLSTNWIGQQMGAYSGAPTSRVKVLGTDANYYHAWANPHLTVHRINEHGKKWTSPRQL